MKVSINKKEIEKIVKEYGCTESEAAKAYLDATDCAQKTFVAELTERLGPRNDSGGAEFDVKKHTPSEIKHHLDKYVIGQEEYKKRICIASAYHFAMIKYLQENPAEDAVKRFRKKNTIIAGPSGSGKTYCAEVLGDLLQIPTLIIDATDYTESGYVGKTADDMVREVIDMAPGANKKEQVSFIKKNGAIIFVDEIDKKAKDGALIGHDISREGFQRSVLKLIERKYVSIDNPYSPVSQIQEAMEKQGKTRKDKKDKMISSENILFILGGSFERTIDNLESIVKKRTEHRGQVKEDGTIIIKGFGLEENNIKKEKYQNYYKEANADDYIRFGLIPELVGRVPIRTFVNLLSKNDLIRIMEETEDSILTQYKLEFKLFNIDLKFTPGAIDYVAEISENRKTGARALVSVWGNILTDFQFELPGSNFTDLVLTRELCEKPKDALLKMLERSPFVDFVENFKKEFGIELIMDEEVTKYVEAVAAKHNMQVSATLKKLLAGASALNYIQRKKPFRVTMEMLKDKKYFDKLFMEWHKKQTSRGGMPG